MAVLELQINQAKFLDLLRAELNGLRLPVASIPGVPQLAGRLLERIECTQASLSPGNAIMEPGSVGQDMVLVDLALTIHHTTLADARAAGSMNAPVVQQTPAQAQVRLQVVPRVTPGATAAVQVLEWRLTSLRVADTLLLAAIVPPGQFAVDVPEELTVVDGTINPAPGMIVLRLGTALGDDLRSPAVSRLENHDWALLISGQVFGDLLAEALATALEAEVKDPKSKAAKAGIRVIQEASGAWFPAFYGLPPSAAASARLEAEDACIIDSVPIHLQLIGMINATGPVLQLTVTLSWDVETTLCAIELQFLTPFFSLMHTLVLDSKVANALLKTKTPDEFVEIGRTDESITFRRNIEVGGPGPRFVLMQSGVTDEGVVVRGRLDAWQPKRALNGFVFEPASELDVDCRARTAVVTFRLPRVFLADPGVQGGAPRLLNGLNGVTYEPADAWVADTGTASSWLELALVFRDPPAGRKPVGTPTSAYLHTDCGLRWADLGTVPADRPPPTPGEIAVALAPCFAISDKWGSGKLNPDWLVDPPFDHYGIDPLREWTFAFEGLPEAVRLEILAVKADGAERLIGVLMGRRDVAVRVTTDADEVAEVRVGGPSGAPAPRVLQRWIVPSLAVELGEEPVAIAAASGSVGMLRDDGELLVLDTRQGSLQGVRREDAFGPEVGSLRQSLTRQRLRAQLPWGTTAAIDDHTVATTHLGRLMVGTAGPQVVYGAADPDGEAESTD